MFKPHITPQSYYDELARGVAEYIKWVSKPRDRDPNLPTPDFLIKEKSHSKAYIKAQLLKGL